MFHIDNQKLFLQHHAAIFIPISDGKMDWPGNLPPQLYIEPHSSGTVFYLKASLCHTEKSDESCVTSAFWVTLGSICQYRLR